MNGRYVLIVDDNLIARAILKNIFNKEFEILEAENGKIGLDFVCKYGESIAVILLDLVMPEMDGYEFLAEIKKRNMLSLIPVIVVSADSDSSIESNILDQGASDMIATPIEPNIVKRRVENVISANNYRHNLEAMTKSLSSEIQQSNSMIVDTLCSIIEQRNLESGQHIKRIRSFTDIILRYLAENCDDVNLDESMIDCISRASTLHDIGKIVIPDSILNKPSRLTAEEFEVMKSHSVEGANIIRKLNFIRQKNYLEYAWQIAMYHHERWDGKGYPEGLSGDAIPLCAQAVSIADVYDALTTHRVYKPVIPHQKAVVMILNGECGAFSEKMKRALRAVAPKFEELSGMFRDGRVPKSFDSEESGSINDDVLDEAFRSDYYKYVTSLQIIDGYVFEVDYDTHAYKLVFPNKSPFANLHVCDDFYKDTCAFVENFVHPDDQSGLLEQLKFDMNLIVSGHNVNSSYEARMRLSLHEDYKRYVFSQIRIDMQSVEQHKSLIVIREADGEKCEVADNCVVRDIENVQSSLAEFRGIGVSDDMLYEVFRRERDILFAFNIDTGAVAFDCRNDELFASGVPGTMHELFEGNRLSVHPDDFPVFTDMLEKIMLGELSGGVDFRVMSRRGDFVRLLGEAFPLLTDGVVSHVVLALKTCSR